MDTGKSQCRRNRRSRLQRCRSSQSREVGKGGKTRKAAVSGDFADSYKKKLALSDSARQLYQNAKYREALDIHYEDLIRRKTDGTSKLVNGREIDAVTNDALIQAKRTISAIDKPKNFLNQKIESKLKQPSKQQTNRENVQNFGLNTVFIHKLSHILNQKAALLKQV